HDDVSDPPTIMFSSSAANLVNKFSETSKGEVASFLSVNSSCLSVSNEAPPPSSDDDGNSFPDPDDGDDPVDPDDPGFDPNSVDVDVYLRGRRRSVTLFVETYNDFDFVGSQPIEILYARKKRQGFHLVATGVTDEFGSV